MAAPEMQFIAREVESLFRAHYSKLVWYAQTLLTRNAQTSDPGRAEEAVQEANARKEVLIPTQIRSQNIKNKVLYEKEGQHL